MDFFAHQDRARRRSKLLVVYFLLAVVATVAALNLAFYLIYYFTSCYAQEYPSSCGSRWFEQNFWWQLSLLSVWVIAMVSAVRIFFLRGGGEKIAEMVRARPISPDTAVFNERKLVNVVDEMSIASGVPVPRLYVMDHEAGINAFVAGYKPTETVLVVTQGCLEHLSRDELQGVVGHEFSHILNGDMRLNVRLIGLLAGILAIGQIGLFLLRSLGRGGGRRSSRGDGRGVLVVLAIGLVLTVVGYIGVFFGRLIKAALSRQREFLADASAVQFTRDPGGIAGALEKIRQHSDGSNLRDSHAEEMSHMCFGQSLHMSFGRLFATHPPLEERIQVLKGARLGRRRGRPPAPDSRSGGSDLLPESSLGFAGGGATVPMDSARLTASIGQVDPAHLAYASALYQTLPPDLLRQAHQTDGARALVYALLFGGNEDERKLRLRLVEHHESKTLARQMLECRRQIEPLGARVRLPLLDLALPALKQLDAPGRDAFLAQVERLVKADRKLSLFEYVVQTLLNKHLNQTATRDSRVVYTSFKPVLEEVALLLALVARTGKVSVEQAEQIYYRIMLSFTIKLIPPARFAEASPLQLNQALQKLAGLSPLLKKSLLNACADCVVADGVVRPQEVELLRAVAESLDCPMPPLVV